MSNELEEILETLGFEQMVGGSWHREGEYVVTEIPGYAVSLYRAGTHYGVDNLLMHLTFVPNTTQKMHLVRESIKTTLGL